MKVVLLLTLLVSVTLAAHIHEVNSEDNKQAPGPRGSLEPGPMSSKLYS